MKIRKLFGLTLAAAPVGLVAATAFAQFNSPFLALGSTTSSGQPTGSCSQSTAFFSRVWALPATLDGTVGGSGHVAAYDNLICGLVTDGVWSHLDAIWVPATNVVSGTATAVANLNLISSSFTLTAHGSPTFTANQGYAGQDLASPSNYFDTGYNPSTTATNFSQNSAMLLSYHLTNIAPSTGGIALGYSNSGGINGSYISPEIGGGGTNGYISLNSGAAFHSAGISSAGGSLVGVRLSGGSTAGTDVLIYYNGANVSSSWNFGGSASVAVANANLYLLALNLFDTSSVEDGDPNTNAAFAIGGSLTATQVSSSGGTTGTGLIPRLCTYLTAVHGSC
jgi:hypothetical protein